MKTIYKVLAVLAIPGFLVFYSFSGGSPGGKSGSPGDGSANCTGCHAGVPQTVGDWITTNIPDDGYIAGETYVITAKGMHEGVGKFGFELTAENADGIKKGSFAVTDFDRTQITGTGNSVTHTQDGNTPAGDSATWSMNWTAPASGSGQVRFYSAFNAANGTGDTSGDVIYLSMYNADENITISVDENHLEAQLSLYPNPATSLLNIKLPEGSELHIVDILGKVVEVRRNTQSNERLDVSRFENGIYFVQVKHEGETHTSRFLKN